MNTCVSDEKVIINIQGIRNVSWGESTSYSGGGGYYVAVTYKGSHNNFQYKTESQARALFQKLREAMDKTVEKKNEE